VILLLMVVRLIAGLINAAGIVDGPEDIVVTALGAYGSQILSVGPWCSMDSLPS
jgi:hypothetical protein